MKEIREFLKGLELEKETINSIVAYFGENVTEDKETITSLKQEIVGLKGQVSEKDTKISELETKVSDFDKVSGDLTELQSKYDADTNELKNQLSTKDYEYKVKEKVSNLRFTSESAKKSFLTDLLTNKLELENEELKGFDDYLKNFKETDPNALESDEKQPVFQTTTGGKPLNTGTKLSYEQLCELNPVE